MNHAARILESRASKPVKGLRQFLDDEQQTSIDSLNDLYVLVNFRPVLTNKNWRMDCGVAGYDNTFGLPPFFPTRLRFEDYIYRMWIQQDGMVAAHVDAAQHHTKSNYMRNPPASEVLNEEIANLLKRKIKSSITSIDELGITFDYAGEVTAQDAEEILDKIAALHQRALQANERARSAAPTPLTLSTTSARIHGASRTSQKSNDSDRSRMKTKR